MICDIIFVEERRCLLKFDDTSAKRKTGSSNEDTLPRRWQPVNCERISCIDTSLTSTPISTKPRKKEIGATWQRGRQFTIKRVQLRRHPQGSRLLILPGQRPALMAYLRQQGNGLLASSHYPSQLHLPCPDVPPTQFSLLQKHNKKIFDMCNIGEDYHLGTKRNEVLKECNRILDREDF